MTLTSNVLFSIFTVHINDLKAHNTPFWCELHITQFNYSLHRFAYESIHSIGQYLLPDFVLESVDNSAIGLDYRFQTLQNFPDIQKTDVWFVPNSFLHGPEKHWNLSRENHCRNPEFNEPVVGHPHVLFSEQALNKTERSTEAKKNTLGSSLIF